MSGMIIKQSEFSSTFRNLQILAIDDRSPKYLVTPIGNGHLDKLSILQISNEHKINDLRSISLESVSNVNRTNDKASQVNVQTSFHKHMLAMKKKYSVSFNFKIN